METFQLHEFSVRRLFPSSDPLAMGILRLMASVNDLRFVHEWISEERSLSHHKAQNIVRTGRWFFRHRLLSALLHETLRVIESVITMPQFAKIKKYLGDSGIEALCQITQVASEKDSKIRKLLRRTRNKVTFHYDEEKFKNTLDTLLQLCEHDLDSSIVEEHFPDKTFKVYYQLPSDIQTEEAFGFDRGIGRTDSPRPEIEVANLLIKPINLFTYRLFKGYLKQKGLEKSLRRQEFA